MTDSPEQMTADVLDVHDGFEQNQFVAFFQPFIHLQSHKVIGGELLARWNHPVFGVLAPAKFLDLIARSNRLRDLTDIMLDQAAAIGAGGQMVSVNLGPDDLDDPSLKRRVRASLDSNDSNETNLCLEVVEADLVSGSFDTLRELNEWGVQVAVDDFGAAYSSLARVIDLQVDIVKLDRSLIERVHQRPRTEVVLRGLIESLHELGIAVIAEGIEQPEELATLAALEVDIAQGYLLGRPQPIDGSSAVHAR